MPTVELTKVAQKAARGGLFLLVGNASSIVILAVGAIMVGRLLGPFSYGLYTLALVVPTLLVGLSDAGMNFAVVRLPARLRSEGDPARANRITRLGMLFKVGISTVAFLICYVGSTIIASTVLSRPELVPFLQLASLLILFQALFDVANNAFVGRDQMQYTAGAQILEAVLKGVLGPVFVFIGLGILGAIWGFVLSLAVAGLVGASVVFLRPAGVRVKVVNPTDAMLSSSSSGRSKRIIFLGQIIDSARTDLHMLLSYGLPLYLANILSVLVAQYQSIVLAHYASNVEIGNFGAMGNFTVLINVLTIPITTAVFPMFSKMDPKSQRSELARGFVLAVKYTSLIVIPASVGMMVFARNLIYLTFGSGYTLAPQYLEVLSVVYLLTGIGYLVLASFLNGVAETRTVVKMSVLSLALYLPLGPALASLWGPVGLLVVYILSYAVATIYGVRQAFGKFDVLPDLKASGSILLSALAAAAPTIALVQLDRLGVGVVNLIVGGLLYLLLYMTLAPITKAVNGQDILNLRTLLGHTPIVARLVDPVFSYESRLLSAMQRHSSLAENTTT